MTPLPSMAALRLLAVVVLLLVGLRPAFAVEVQRVVSPGGIEAWLVEDHTNPIIALQMNFRGGGALDPAGKEGLASMVASTIDEGAGPLDSQGFQGKLNDLSIWLGFSAGFDNFSGSLRSLTENRETAFEMLRLALSEPRFDEEPVERIRAQITAGLTRSLEDPDVIAGLTLRGILMPTHEFVHVRDIMPTILDIADVSHPKEFNGGSVRPMQGQSVLEFISGDAKTPYVGAAQVGYELFGLKAYFDGNWKILKMPPPFASGDWELYNLAEDPAETEDLSSAYPEKVEDMVKKWEQYKEDNAVLDISLDLSRGFE